MHRNEVVGEDVVKVLAAKVSVAGGGLHLEDALVDGQQRHLPAGRHSTVIFVTVFAARVPAAGAVVVNRAAFVASCDAEAALVCGKSRWRRSHSAGDAIAHAGACAACGNRM